MSWSPRATRLAVAASIVTAVTAVGISVGAAQAEDRANLEQQRQGVAGRIDDAKKAFDESSKAFVKATSALKTAQVQLGTAKAHLGQTRQALSGAKALDATLQVKLGQAEGQLAQAQTDLERGRQAHRQSAEAVREFTLQNLTHGNARLEAFGELLHGEDPMQYQQRMSLASAVSDAQIAKMQQLAANEVILKINQERVKKARDQVAAAQAETQRNVVRQQVLTSQAEDQTAEVDRLVDDRESAKDAAAKARAEDERQLKELEAERARLESRIASLVAAEKALGGAGSGDGGGSLSHPVSGPITSGYGMRVHPVTGRYKLHDGTDFGASCGTPIRAAAGGVILEQYFNGGYGNRVILNNGLMRGHSIVTTYNHLSRYAVSVGDHVNRGDVIGYVGSTGYSTGCHLHFMVLVDGHTTDPMGWL
ncbi:MAG TPA: peptidoglycan DD-metalloendopeptidase family protein [Aeromicrobium sp.]|nr:peptidoglycan DD-metalloendopeptidase family protein [Aeromicrobium sp.]